MQQEIEQDRRLSVCGPILEGQARLRALCDGLEAVADGLPAMPPPGVVHDLVEGLLALVPAHQRGVAALLDALASPDEPCALRRALAARIRSQQVTDLVHAQDLGAVLTEPGAGALPELGYMLRCFFLGARRALAFEALALLHLGGAAAPALAAAIAEGLAPVSGRVD